MALLLVIASVANATGLGKLVVLSAMGEPFRAEIELLGVTRFPDTHTTLTPRLASPEIYPLLGFRYNPALTGARLDIRPRANGRHVIEIVSVRPLNEPFVYLLVELESNATRIMRGYTALLDPPGFRSSQATAALEFFPLVVPALKPATVRAPAADHGNAVSRPAPRRERLSDANAKTLLAMLERVAALEVAVGQLQRQREKPAVVAALQPAAEAPPAAKPVAATAVPVAASPPRVVQVAPEKPAVPVEASPRRVSGQDSLLNNALLVLAVGLLILLGGLVYVLRGRPAVQERPAKDGG